MRKRETFLSDKINCYIILESPVKERERNAADSGLILILLKKPSEIALLFMLNLGVVYCLFFFCKQLTTNPNGLL